MKKLCLSLTALLFCFSTPLASAQIRGDQQFVESYESYKGLLKKVIQTKTTDHIEEEYVELHKSVYDLQPGSRIDGTLQVTFEEVVGNEVYVDFNWFDTRYKERETLAYKVTVELNDRLYNFDYAKLTPEQKFWLSDKGSKGISVQYKYIEGEKRKGYHEDDPAEYFNVEYLEIGNHSTKNLIGAYSYKPIFRLELSRDIVFQKKGPYESRD